MSQARTVTRRAALVRTGAALCGLAGIALAGCEGHRYHVIAGSGFWGVKADYAAGDHVRLTYGPLAEDINYHFYVDGESVHAYWRSTGYVIEFTMPAHDVTVTCDAYESREPDLSGD